MTVNSNVMVFEFVRGNSSKYWTIQTRDLPSQYWARTQWGKRWFAGQSTTKCFPDKLRRDQYVVKLIAEKLSKGYVQTALGPEVKQILGSIETSTTATSAGTISKKGVLIFPPTPTRLRSIIPRQRKKLLPLPNEILDQVKAKEAIQNFNTNRKSSRKSAPTTQPQKSTLITPDVPKPMRRVVI